MAESIASGGQVMALSQRSSKLMAFTGALIVFVTFVVKEGREESYKGIAQSVELATQVFAIRSDIIKSEQQQLSLAISVNEIHGRLQDQAKNEGSADTEHMSTTVNTGMSCIEATDDNTSTLLKSIQGSEADSLRAKLADAQKSNSKLSETRQLYAKESRPGPADAVYSNDIKLNFKELVLKSQIAQKDATERGEEALRIAMQYRDRAQRHYENYLMLSYVLYTIGWGLALVGRMFGVEAVGM